MMIRNLIFDYGSVLLDWNPHFLYDSYFGSTEKADWFLNNICTYTWNVQHDSGRPVAEGTEELISVHPEWEKEIRMYYGEFPKMIGGQIPGMLELIREFKAGGLHAYGLTNWSAETFAMVRNDYPILDEMEGMVISGEEKVMKPSPRIYLTLLNRYGLKKEECVFIDDREPNLAGGEAVGIRGILFESADKLRTDIYNLLKEND